MASDEKKKPLPLKRLIPGLLLLALLLAAGGYMGSRVHRLAGDVAVERSRTPTPEPPYGNVMRVTPDPSAPTPQPVLRSGAQGDEVIALQERLQALGYYSGEIDGRFGTGTTAAVKLFQQENGLEVDGIVGADTRNLLASGSAKPCPTPTASPTPAPTNTPAAVLPWVRPDGLPLLVNADNHLPEGYQTVELVKMRSYCDSSLVKIKGSEIQGERIAVDALQRMLRAAREDGVTNWQVSAGYRSLRYQQQLFDEKVAAYMKEGRSASGARKSAAKSVALPGASEHHTGLAFDITVPGASFKGTRQQKWLAANCWDYGFIIRYPEDKVSITGISSEPWHIRYVGMEHALRMRDENLCLEEYVGKYSR